MGSRPPSLALFCIELLDSVGTKQDLMNAKNEVPFTIIPCPSTAAFSHPLSSEI